jgi:predicted double-glycine peptidase
VRDLAAFLRTDIDKDAPPESLPLLLAGLEQRGTSPLSVSKAATELGYPSRDVFTRRL